jgi:hypothetical protein
VVHERPRKRRRHDSDDFADVSEPSPEEMAAFRAESARKRAERCKRRRRARK